MDRIDRIFTNCLKFFDYFGIIFNFKLKADYSFQTRTGGAVFLLFLFFVLYFFILTFYDFITRSVYNINYSTKVVNPAPSINLHQAGFMFAYALEYNNGSSIYPDFQDSIEHKVTLIKMSDSDSKNKNKTIIKSNLCKHKDLNKNINLKTFKNLNLDHYYCLNITPDITIEGTYTNNIYQYIQLDISINKNYLNYNTSSDKNLDVLGKSININGLRVALYWADTTHNVEKKDYPISAYLKNYIRYFDFWYLQKINMDFSIVEFSTDMDMIFQRPESFSNITFKEISEYFITAENRTNIEKGGTLISIYLRSSCEIIKIDRTYQKIAEFFANLGGLQSNIFFFLYIIMNFFNQFRANMCIMNNCIKYREHFKVNYPHHCNYLKFNLTTQNKDPEESQFQKRQESEFGIGISNKNYVNFKEDINKSMEDEKNIEMKQVDNKAPFDVNVEQRQRELYIVKDDTSKVGRISKSVEDLVRQSNSPVDFNTIEIICRKCVCRSKSLAIKSTLYDKGVWKLDYYFDVITFIQKMQEIDILKYLLLDKDQYNLINFISKPSVSLSLDDSDVFYNHVRRNRKIKSRLNREELEEVIESYNLLKARDYNFNKKLFSLFDNEIDHLLQ